MSIAIPNDLIFAKEVSYQKHGYNFSQLVIDSESINYGACTFKLNNSHLIFRTAKITPTKIGQFVTLWKRDNSRATSPFSDEDHVDFVIISTRYGTQIGQFIFPKQILIAQQIISTTIRNGKCGFRVYPPWDLAVNKQAKETQKWQLRYFLNLTEEDPTISVSLQALMNGK